MAKKFVRNITDTKCKGRNQEPLETNRQNDLLSDEHDVYVRNKDYYHCLTNAIQKIESKNDSIIVSKKDKNTVELEYVGGGGGGGTPGTSTPTEIISKSKYIDVKEVGTNKFELSTVQLEIELEEIRKLIEEMGSGGDDGFLGNVTDYDFKPIKDNTMTYEQNANPYHGLAGPVGQGLSIKKDAGLVKAFIKSDYNRGDLPLEFKFEGLEPTIVKNIRIEIFNESEKTLPITFRYSVRKENDTDWEDNEIKLKPRSITRMLTTVYTDPDSKKYRHYLKVIEDESID